MKSKIELECDLADQIVQYVQIADATSLIEIAEFMIQSCKSENCSLCNKLRNLIISLKQL